mmetsp:Transcript_7678/g.23448  ORF Transcript_7678/g.23448 Transcript_7678/m.23448 type:complete len:204 (-) Transcript_7678:431-1042(-)
MDPLEPGLAGGFRARRDGGVPPVHGGAAPADLHRGAHQRVCALQPPPPEGHRRGRRGGSAHVGVGALPGDARADQDHVALHALLRGEHVPQPEQAAARGRAAGVGALLRLPHHVGPPHRPAHREQRGAHDAGHHAGPPAARAAQAARQEPAAAAHGGGAPRPGLPGRRHRRARRLCQGGAGGARHRGLRRRAAVLHAQRGARL